MQKVCYFVLRAWYLLVDWSGTRPGCGFVAFVVCQVVAG